MGILRNPTALLITKQGPLQLEEWEVHQSKTKKGDTFHAKTAMNAPGCDVGFWAGAEGDQLDVQLVINGVVLFDGSVDHADVAWRETGVSFSGRDKGAKLIDKTSSEKFLNQKPGDIVQTYAKRHGLSAVVDTASDKAGKSFKDDWDSIAHRGSEWSHIQSLADHYGMNAYMTGGKIYFKDIDEDLPPFIVWYSPPTPASHADGSFISLHTSRNMILSRPVKTNVRSHNHKEKKLISSQHSKGGSGDALVYNYVLPGLKKDQADRICKKRHHENTKHEFAVDVDLPGDETVNVRRSLQLQGTGTAFDQTYEIDGIEHRGSFGEGYRMRIAAKAGKGS
jgi:phage protein D